MEALSRRPAVEDFSGALVEHFLIGAELLVGDLAEVGALGEVVADAVVLAFAGGAFPRAVGMAKEDLEPVAGHFIPERNTKTCF